MSKRKETYYTALAFAGPYLYDKPSTNLTVRIDRKADWAYISHNGKEIWDCNLVFFREHFLKQESHLP